MVPKRLLRLEGAAASTKVAQHLVLTAASHLWGSERCTIQPLVLLSDNIGYQSYMERVRDGADGVHSDTNRVGNLFGISCLGGKGRQQASDADGPVLVGSRGFTGLDTLPSPLPD